jgi:hypothetical protein
MDQEIEFFIHNRVLLSQRKNDMWFEGKQMQIGEHHVK